MRKDNFFKLLCSFPVILLIGYFLPPLGVILAILRYVVYGKYHFWRTPVVLIICALLMLAPRGLELAKYNFNFDLGIPYWSDIIAHPLYPKITDYGKFILIYSIILAIVARLLQSVIDSANRQFSRLTRGATNAVKQQIEKEMSREAAIKKENDYKLREKAITAAENTPHVVKCPYCGVANSFTGNTTKCTHCRQAIEYKPPKKSYTIPDEYQQKHNEETS